MIALMILTALIVYVGIALLVIKRLPSKKAKWIAIAVFVLIPTWDEIAGRLYFYVLCASEGGQKIYKTIEIGKEYYGPTAKNAKLPDGIQWEVGKVYTIHVEGDHPTVKRSVRFVPDPDKLKDRYEIAVAKNDSLRILGVQRRHSYVKVKRTGELLGEATSFLYWGGWIANSSGLHITATECPTKPTNPDYVHSPFLEKLFPLKNGTEK